MNCDVKISVRKLVEFVYAGGDLTSDVGMNRRAVEGIELHQFLQNQYTDQDQKEVFVELNKSVKGVDFCITGRIDGVLNHRIIHEIKSTRLDLSQIDINARPEHLTQAKMYAYMYALKEGLTALNVRLTYITTSFAIKHFDEVYTFEELSTFFENTINTYLDWHELLEEHQTRKKTSIEGLSFPFEQYRDGQKGLMSAVYQTFLKNDIVFAEAPTGIGKTVASLTAAIKSISDPKEKIFYLTAKNAAKDIVVDTVNLLKDHGLETKSVVISAKEHMCLMDKVDCDPDICPYAKGFFDRVMDGLKDIFEHEDVYEPNLIKEYGEKHRICPYEFSLMISNYSDIVICDYNFAFDPVAHLIRFFDDDYYLPKLLIDEAHNLVNRSRSMYSAFISEEDIQPLLLIPGSISSSVHIAVNVLNKWFNKKKEELDLEKAKEVISFELDSTYLKRLDQLTSVVETMLNEHKKFDMRKDVLDIYFSLLRFKKIADYFDKQFYMMYELKNGQLLSHIVCLDASPFLQEVLTKRSFGAAFFSATLSPLDFYVDVISGGLGQTIQIPSPFPAHHLDLVVDATISTRFKDRRSSIDSIIDHLYAILEHKVGNYIVFFPSYAYLKLVLEKFEGDSYDVIEQTPFMTQSMRSSVIEQFDQVGKKSKIGFFVLGGSFSEGIDFVGEKLSGVIVVGVGLPAFNQHNQLLREYFDKQEQPGYHYAYTYPGMNRVIQAVGRVIRSEIDRGIAVLIDDRFAQTQYRQLFPPHWQHAQYKSPGIFMIDLLKKLK
jgi:DNA excision repair protein ERCC-2